MIAVLMKIIIIIFIIIVTVIINERCSLLLENNQLKSNEIESYQSISAAFYTSGSIQEEKVFMTTNKLICFFAFTKKFNPEIMNGLCTHINVGFFGINQENSSLEISSEQKQILSQIILLRHKAKDLKIIISVGGAGNKDFSSMVTNHTTRKMFIRSCMKFIKEFKIDGIDLDWEWPVIENGDPKEKVKLVQLLQEIRKEFNRHKKKYIISVDVPSIQAVIEIGYYINYIAKYVDYVNVMCYDYHYFTKFFPFTGHNAPLYSTPNELIFKNINHSIYFWISNSMPREKIVLGIPTYGHTFELTFSHKHSLVAPAKGFGSVGQYGFADFQDICKFLKLNGTTVVYDKISKVPYAYRFPEWISYDDEKSLAIKADYILKEKLSGAMVFSVNSDDFSGSCKGNGLPLPLIRKIRKDEMIQCPYNLSHVILKHRMATHLIKCRQQHSKKKFVNCPFNRIHDVPESELKSHAETCPERKHLENYIYVIDEPKLTDEQPTQIKIPSSSENWDEERSIRGSYLDVKNEVLEKKLVLRQPVGLSKTSRKEFFHNEVQRLQPIKMAKDSSN